MEYTLSKFKIKPGRRAQLESFLTEVKERGAELAPILEQSGILIDITFVDATAGGETVYIFKKVSDNASFLQSLDVTTSSFLLEIKRVFEECCETRHEIPVKLMFDRSPLAGT